MRKPLSNWPGRDAALRRPRTGIRRGVLWTINAHLYSRTPQRGVPTNFSIYIHANSILRPWSTDSGTSCGSRFRTGLVGTPRCGVRERVLGAVFCGRSTRTFTRGHRSAASLPILVSTFMRIVSCALGALIAAHHAEAAFELAW